MSKWTFRKHREAPKPIPVYAPGTMLSVRVSAENLAFLKVLALARGVTLSAYVRDQLLRENPDLIGCVFDVGVEKAVSVTTMETGPHFAFEWSLT